MKNKNIQQPPVKKVKIEKLQDIIGKSLFVAQAYLIENNYRWSINHRLVLDTEKKYIVVYVNEWNTVTGVSE